MSYTTLLRANNLISATNNDTLTMQIVDWYCADSKEIQYYKMGKHLYQTNYFYSPDSDDDDDDESESGSSEEDSRDKEFDSEFLIYIYGLTDNGDSISIKVNGFKPFFYIKVPDNWRPFQLEVLMNKLKQKIWPNKYKSALVSYKLIKSKSFYHFTANDKFNFAQLVFEDYDSFRKWSYLFRKEIMVYGLNGNKPTKYHIYESNINPMIRMIHINEISPSGWIQLPAKSFRVMDNKLIKQSTCQLELETEYQNIKPVMDKSDIAPMIIAAFDIEADSSHGDFPVPKKDYQKLGRDIVTEYVNLMTDGDHAITNYPREVLKTWLRLAFEDYYQNYGLNKIVTEDNIKPDPETINSIIPNVLQICKSYSSIYRWEQENLGTNEREQRHHSSSTDEEMNTDNQPGKLVSPARQVEKRSLVKRLHELFEMNLPIVDLDVEKTSHYGLLAQQVLNEYSSLDYKNTEILQNNQEEWLRYVINLAFDDYFDSHNINRIYTKKNKKPIKTTLENIIPQIHQICHNCYDVVEEKAKRKRLGAKWADKNNKEEDKEKELTQDDFVNELSELLNTYLPEVKGDMVIQIGTTFQRYGEKHPFLKHIITLDTCEEIDNRDLIADEHKDIEFPDRELTNGLKKIYKEKDTLATFQIPEVLQEILEKLFGTEELTLKKLDKSTRTALNQLLLDYNLSIQLKEDTSIVVVEQYKTEKEVLMAWTKLIQQSDPDVVIGYNVFGFDYKFLYERSDQLGCMEEFTKLGRFKDIPQGLTEQNLSSSGLGENILYYIPMFGRIIVDLYKVVQAGHKLPMYGLNYVSKHFMYKSKNDISPQDIFIKQKGSAADRRLIAEYCLIDCVLCNRLINKLDIITNNIGMSNVCLVPLSYLFLRGQGVKILSLVAQQCRNEGYLIPTHDKKDIYADDDGYEGAIVLPPKSNIYFEPVVVCDFNSLYPSCMISENLSHDSYVIPGSQYDNLPDYDYVDIQYDLYREEPVPGRKITKKVKCGVKTCRFAQMKDGTKSLLPRILMGLLKARKDTRKDQKAFPKGSFQWKVKEGLQLAYKITANSLYGQVGARTSAIYLKDIAACTTATGRKLIYFTKNFFEGHYKGCEAVYGDSVTGDTPLLLMDAKSKTITIKTIETLVEETGWSSYDNFKPGEPNRSNKQQGDSSYLIWTNGVWTPIKRVIRHKTIKDIYRINTHTGVVDVTEDHSLLDKNSNIIKPTNTIVGTELLHSFPDMKQISNDIGISNYTGPPKHFNEIYDAIYKYDSSKDTWTNDEKEAYVYGFFYSDGSCGKYYSEKYSWKYSWALNNANKTLLNRCVTYLNIIESGKTQFKILETIKSSAVYKLVPFSSVSSTMSLKYMVDKYRPLFYDKDKYKIIPDKILNAPYDIRMAFLIGYYSGDGCKCINEKSKTVRYDNKGKIGSAQLYYLSKSLGYNCSINTRNDKPDIYRITTTLGIQRKNPIAVKKNLKLVDKYTDFVYDIETTAGSFQAGIGEIIVKNTDSVFLKFDCRDGSGSKLYGLDAINKSIELCIEGSLAISRQLKRPHNLEFEKAILPFILITKKRYHGHYFTEYGNPSYYANSMGIVLKRRDNAAIVKHVFGSVVDIIMKEHDIEKAMKHAQKMARDLLEGKYPLDMFIITKSLKSYYKNPMQIAHNVLAQRIGKRDPGNKPQANDRIPYVYITVPEGAEKTTLQGDRIETPQFVVDNDLKIDYKFYLTNQIMKPVAQIFELVMDDVSKLFSDPIRDYDYKQQGVRKITDWYTIKKVEKKDKAAAIAKYLGEDEEDEEDDEDINETDNFTDDFDTVEVE